MTTTNRMINVNMLGSSHSTLLFLRFSCFGLRTAGRIVYQIDHIPDDGKRKPHGICSPNMHLVVMIRRGREYRVWMMMGMRLDNVRHVCEHNDVETETECWIGAMNIKWNSWAEKRIGTSAPPYSPSRSLLCGKMKNSW